MVRKSQIHIVNLSMEAPTPSMDEPENEVPDLNERKEEIKQEEEVKKEEPMSEPPPEETPKPKRKAAPRKKKPIEEEKPVEEAKPIEETKQVEEKTVEENKPVKKTKTVELVKCEKCEKELTKRTLRYDHEKTCPGEPIKRENIPVKRRTPIKKNVPEEETISAIPNEVIEQEVKKRIQNISQERIQQRLKMKDERIKKLSAQIA